MQTAHGVRASLAPAAGRRSFLAALIAPLVWAPRATFEQSEAGRHPHASTDVAQFVAAGGAYAFAHPTDWKVHEAPGRVTVGADDGLVPTERGFRTVYGVIIAIVDDPEAATPQHDIAASARAVVDSILKRNPHQSISAAVRTDRPFAG